MKLKVIGWTSYSTPLKQGKVSWAAQYAIIEEIKKHGYSFSGWAHQEGYGCAPVLNDGKVYRFSQRGWGGIMAEAHGYTGSMDYSLYAFAGDRDKEIRPEGGYDESAVAPEGSLAESFSFEVSEAEFLKLHKKRKIKWEDVPALKYLDAGDRLIFTCKEQLVEYIVTDVERQKDLTEEEMLEWERRFYNAAGKPDEMKKAEEEFDSIKTVMMIKVKKPKIN